jgi:hypothetical protein
MQNAPYFAWIYGKFFLAKQYGHYLAAITLLLLL